MRRNGSRGLGDVAQPQRRAEEEREQGVEKVVGVIQGEDRRALRGEVLTSLDDDLAEEESPDEAEEGGEHVGLSGLFRLFGNPAVRHLEVTGNRCQGRMFRGAVLKPVTGSLNPCPSYRRVTFPTRGASFSARAFSSPSLYDGSPR